jgi:FKBP-type peptidyl-prolyl cis-trans isomerase SlyD
MLDEIFFTGDLSIGRSPVFLPNKGDIMIIKENVFVSFDYRLTLDSGEEVDKSPSGQPLGFITGAGQIIPGLERKMIGMSAGDSVKISVEPENAYGLVNPELFQEVKREQFPSDMEIKPGMTFQSQGPHGSMIINVSEIKDENTVVIDLNHPLAGKRLHFDINIADVRDLTPEEAASLSSGCGCGCGCESEEEAGCSSGGCGSEGGCCH